MIVSIILLLLLLITFVWIVLIVYDLLIAVAVHIGFPVEQMITLFWLWIAILGISMIFKIMKKD